MQEYFQTAGLNNLGSGGLKFACSSNIGQNNYFNQTNFHDQFKNSFQQDETLTSNMVSFFFLFFYADQFSYPLPF